MQKVAGERYVYKFVCDPEALFTMAFPDNTRPLLKSELLKDDTCCGNAGSNSNAHSNMISSRHYPQLHHGGHSPSSGFSSPGSHDSRDQPLALTVGAIVPGEGGHNNQHLNGGSHLNDFRSAAAASSVNPLSHQDMCSQSFITTIKWHTEYYMGSTALLVLTCTTLTYTHTHALLNRLFHTLLCHPTTIHPTALPQCIMIWQRGCILQLARSTWKGVYTKVRIPFIIIRSLGYSVEN